MQKSLEAAVLLEDDGYDVEVVDVRSLSPLDTETICESVNRTGSCRGLRRGLQFRRGGFRDCGDDW